MSKGLIVVIRSLIGSLVCVVVGAASASMTTSAGVVAVNQGTAHEALYGLCLSEGRATAVGQGGLVLESLDGGETWNERNRFTDAALFDVDCGPALNCMRVRAVRCIARPASRSRRFNRAQMRD